MTLEDKFATLQVSPVMDSDGNLCGVKLTDEKMKSNKVDCDYCMDLKPCDNKFNKTLYGKLFDTQGFNEFSIGKQEDGKYILHYENEDGISDDATIKYCPYCGRKLI